MPDKTTFTPLPYNPGSATVLGIPGGDGRPWDHCRGRASNAAIARAEGKALASKPRSSLVLLLRQSADGELRPVDQTNLR